MRNNYFDQVITEVGQTANLGIVHLTTDNKGFVSNLLHMNNKEYLNFSLCDYLGLSQDERLKQKAIEAIHNHGVYTTVSKSYIKLKIYEEAEEGLAKIFNRPVLVFSRTTMAHIGVLPVITTIDDAIIIDHQAHASIGVAADILKSHGYYVEVMRHSRMDILEDTILKLKSKYKKIWYLTDSVYSMYGDILPFDDIKRLLNKYEQFHLYVDDAHGMSWVGENGNGFLLNNLEYHPQMVLITSLGKGYGAGGGAVICYDKAMYERIKTCASSLIFTLPLAPANLAAIAESAKIHLSTEIYTRQAKLNALIDYFKELTDEYQLPNISDPNTPISFIATGKTDMCREICSNIINKGYFINAAHLPAVPLNNSGIRIAITLYHSREDIKNLLSTIRDEYQMALSKRNITTPDIVKHYKTVKQVV